MKSIDLSTAQKALSYLRTLPDEHMIEIPDKFDPAPHAAEVDALEKIAGESAYDFAVSRNRWNWPVALAIPAALEGRSVFVPQENSQAVIDRVLGDGDFRLDFENGEEGFYSPDEVQF